MVNMRSIATVVVIYDDYDGMNALALHSPLMII